MRALAAIVVAFVLLVFGTACGERNPCRALAERDCARHGEDSALCQEARRLAASADPYLVEICRKELSE